MTRLVLHLGDQKTGSTAIQAALARRAVAAPGLRILYPAPINHIPLARSLSQASEARFRNERFGKIARAIRAARPDVAILSAEHFELVDPAVLADALARHMPDLTRDMTLVAYVRPHGERLVATYAERLKQGLFEGTMEALHRRTLKTARFFYAPRFAKWRQVFGEAFVLRPFVRARLAGGDVVRDFLTLALSGADFVLKPVPTMNAALSVEDLALMRILQSRIEAAGIPDGPALQAQIGWALAQFLSERPTARATRLGLPRKLAERLVADYRDDARALDAAFFDGRPIETALDRAVQTALPAPQSLEPKDHFDAATIRLIEACAWLAAELVSTRPAAWRDFLHQRQRLRFAPDGDAHDAA